MFSTRSVRHLGLIFFILLLTSAAWGTTPLFQRTRNYDLGLPALSVATADVNGDGRLDLLVTDGGSLVGVSMGKGDGSFPLAQTYNSGGWKTNFLAVGDVNGDGHLDLIATSSCESSNTCTHGLLSVFLGYGDGTFRTPQIYDSGAADARSVVLADVNGDLTTDLVVANNCVHGGDCSSGAVTVLLGNGDGTFQAARSFNSGGQNSTGVAVSDVNLDGKLDAVVSNYCSGGCKGAGTIGILLGNGDGTFQPARSYSSDNGNTVAVADVNRDGRPDIFVGHFCAEGNACLFVGIQMFLGNGDGTFQAARYLSSGGRSATSLVIQDVSRDGRLDIIAANRCPNGNYRYDCYGGVAGVSLGNDNGTFKRALRFPLKTPHATSLAVGDVNGDGKADLLVAGGLVSVLLGTARYVTTTGVSSNPSLTSYGQAVTLQATVGSQGPDAPTGTVTFKYGTYSLGHGTLDAGVATLTTRKLPIGTYSITAVYNGDTDFYTSTSTAVVQVVNRATSVTTIQSSQNPCLKGEPIQFVATVTSPTARITGAVIFTAGTTTLGTVTLDGAGTAKITTSTLPKGPTTITATYNGTGNIVGSTASLIQRVHE
jgi:hypothetical protein